MWVPLRYAIQIFLWARVAHKWKKNNNQTTTLYSSLLLSLQLLSKKLSSSLISLVHLMALPSSFPISLQSPGNVQNHCYKQCVWLLLLVKYVQNVMFFVWVSYFSLLQAIVCLHICLMKQGSLMLSWITKYCFTYVKLLNNIWWLVYIHI